MRMLIAALAASATLSASADFQFPPVPVLGTIQAEFTIATPNGVPIAGLPVLLSVVGQCGTVSPSSVTTDTAGVGRFNFVAGNTPGVCTIAGSSNGTTLFGHTTVFRPSDVKIESALWTMRTGTGTATWESTLKVTAANQALGAMPIDFGQWPFGGPTLLSGSRLTTDASGAVRIRYRETSLPGVYDLPMQFAGLERRIRANVFSPSFESVPNGVKVQGSPWDNTRVIMLNGSETGCAFTSAIKFGGAVPPPNVAMFGGFIQMNLTCQGSSPLRMRIEHPDPLPADGQVWLFDCSVGGMCWKQLPAEVSGNSVTFTVSQFKPPGAGPSPGQAEVSLGRPGNWPPPAPPRVGDMWWSGPAENGWGMSIVQTEFGSLFAALFGYDAGGEPTWWVMPDGEWLTPENRFTTAAYSPIGTPWYNYDAPVFVVGDPIGRMQMRFSDANHATLDYTFNGVPGRKTIERQVFAAPVASPVKGPGGMWWGGTAQNGWGVAVVQQGNALFSVWYTYGADNKPRWYVMPNGRWIDDKFTAYEGRIYRTRGSPFLGAPYDPSRLQVNDVGSFSMSFAVGRLTFRYNLEGREGTLVLEKQL